VAENKPWLDDNWNAECCLSLIGSEAVKTPSDTFAETPMKVNGLSWFRCAAIKAGSWPLVASRWLLIKYRTCIHYSCDEEIDIGLFGLVELWCSALIITIWVAAYWKENGAGTSDGAFPPPRSGREPLSPLLTGLSSRRRIVSQLPITFAVPVCKSPLRVINWIGWP